MPVRQVFVVHSNWAHKIGTKQSPAGVEIGEWLSHPAVHAWEDSSVHSLGLEVKETPEPFWDVG